jgi:hypothetical protein
MRVLALHVGKWAGAAAFFPLIGLILGLAADDTVLVTLFSQITLHAIAGLGGSYFLHECAHIFLLANYPSIKCVDVATSWTRFSLHPQGTLTPLQMTAVGAVGPLGCVAVGAVLWLTNSSLAYWYLGHIIFLLPIFGDGRAIIFSLAKMRSFS